MRLSDVDILEFLNGHSLQEFVAPPTVIAVNMGLSEGTVWQRVRILNAAGLLDRTDEDRGYYASTDLGQRYLTGDLTDDEYHDLREFDPDDI